MTSLKAEPLMREFHYNGIRIPDPGSDLISARLERPRGRDLAVQPVVLPRGVVAAPILLPYFSPGFKYTVSVTMGEMVVPQRLKAWDQRT